MSTTGIIPQTKRKHKKKKTIRSKKIMLNQIKRITTDAGIKGIELYFDSKPTAAIIERLKAAFFRWHSGKKCWYAKANDNTERIAQELKNADRIQTPRGSFKVSAVFTSEEAAEAAGFGYYFTNTDGRKIYTQHGNPDNVCLVTAFAVVDPNTSPAEPADKKEQAQKAPSLAPLWERCDVSTIPEHNRHADTKTICAECREHLKKRFPEMKFTIRKTGHNSIDADIISGPYNREKVMTDRFGNPDPWGRWVNSDELEAVLKYCDAFLQSYNYDNSDTQTDYFDVNFYGHFTVSSSYAQTEQGADVVADIKDFATKKADFEAAEQARRDAEWEAQKKQAEKDRAEAEAAALVTNAKISEIESHVKTVDLDESEAFAVLGLVEDVGKSASMEEVERHDERAVLDSSRNYRDAIISRKVEFTDGRIFRNFCSLFLHDFDFLRGFGGWAVEDARIKDEKDLNRLNRKQRESVKSFSVNCIAIYFDGVFQFAIDPEGYGYARYILFPVGIFDEKTDTQSAAEYLAERREETRNLPDFYFPATIAEQLEESNVQEGEDVTMFKVNEWTVIAEETRGKLVDIQPTTWAQYKDAAKVSILPNGKRKPYTDYIHAGQAVAIFRGNLPKVPDSLLYSDVTHHPETGATLYFVNYAGSAAGEYLVKVIDYFEKLGYSPIIDLIQR